MCRFIFVNCYLFLNIKSVKIYAIPIIFTTTLLLYKLDTLLLKQKNLPVLMRKKKPVISNTGHFFCFNSTVSYAYTLAGGHLHLEFLGFSLSSIQVNPAPPQPNLDILFSPFGLPAPKNFLRYLVCKHFRFEWTLLRFIQKHVVHNTFDIYVCIIYVCIIYLLHMKIC